jgi:hypothetical protein
MGNHSRTEYNKGEYRQYGYGVRSYNRPNNFTRGNYAPRPQKKRSGCKKGYINGEAERPYYSGWNFSKRNGFISIIAGPTKKSKDREKDGKRFQIWLVKYKIGQYAKPQLTSGFLDLSSFKLRIPDLGLVMNPKTNYCGTMNFRK